MNAHQILSAVFVSASFAVGATAFAESKKLDGALIDKLTSAKGALNADENVYKVTFPRDDVRVAVDGTSLPPFMGLTSWAAFMPGMQDAMVMGDIVLFQDEVDAAMSAALNNGLAVTGLHNHFFFDEPKVFFMHIGGEGTVEVLANGVRKTLDSVRDVRARNVKPASGWGRAALSGKSSLSAAPLVQIIADSSKPAEKDGMVKFTIGRKVAMSCGCEVGKEMGVNTWAAFMGSSDQAIVDGDFATVEGELQPVLKALRSNDISVVAIHNHMEGDNPKVIFLHYWGVGPAEKLAQGVRSALNAQAVVSRRRNSSP